MGSTTVDPALSERNGLISEKAAAIGVKEIAGSDQDDANSVGAGGASDVVLLLQRQVTDLAEKIKEMELLLKERDVDKRTTNTEDESKTDTDDKPTEEEPAKEEDSKGVESKEEEEVEVKFGSIAGVKLIPYNANLTTYQIVTAEDSNKSHAIVAMYETPASRKPSMEISQAEVLDTGLLPIRIAINSSHIISRLKSVSGTSLCDEPCIMLPPYKLFMSFWDEIQKELPVLVKQFIEDYGQSPDEELDLIKEEPPIGPLDKEATEKKNKRRKARDEIIHWKCLIDFVPLYLREPIDLRVRIAERKIEKISFKNLWYLFSPGDVIVGREPFGQHKMQAYQVFSVTKGRYNMKNALKDEKASADRDPLELQCFYLDFDGDAIDLREEILKIKPYVGLKKIVDLDFYPKDYCSDSDKTLMETLRKRGENFIDYRYCHGSYDGITTRFNLEHVDGEVFVDFKSGYEENPVWKKETGNFGKISPPECSSDETYEPSCTMKKCTSCSNVVYLDEQVDIKRCEAFNKSDRLPKRVPNSKADDLKKEKSEYLYLLPRHLLAYGLRTKQWHFIDVDLFEKTQTDDAKRERGFRNLVIPPRYKELLKAMVKDHATSMENMSGASSSRPRTEIDLVRGKGRGRIIFLYGPPGVGKTSTAETIAAFTTPARPLYPITCADLGSDPTTIQTQLEGHFKLAHRWNCVLLLDEADVYLAERTHTDLARNGIVSVFLRTLEYYSGILFLTSNREGSIDEAFKSRIHVALRYPRIDRNGTIQIWDNILNGIIQDNKEAKGKLKIEFEKDPLIQWAGEHFDNSQTTWNGRQIRNAFQSAIALASYERLKAIQKLGLTEEMAMKRKVFQRIVLRPKHFDDIAKVVHEFEDYLQQCRQGDEFRYKQEGIRADDYEPQNQMQSAYAQAIPQDYPTYRSPPPAPPIAPRARRPEISTASGPPAPSKRRSQLLSPSGLSGSSGGGVVDRAQRGPAGDRQSAYGSNFGASATGGMNVTNDVDDDYAVGDYDEDEGEGEGEGNDGYGQEDLNEENDYGAGY